MTKTKKTKSLDNSRSRDTEATGNKVSFKEAIELINKEDIDSLRTIIDNQKEIINEKDEGENSLLHYAVATGKKKVVSLLLEKGADVGSEDYFKNTPLHVAACKVDLELVKFLVEEGKASLKVVNEANRTVLHSAASGIIDEEGEENWEVIEYLLEKGVPTNVISEGGFSVSDVFFSKDWSYADIYEKVKEKVKKRKAGTEKEEESVDKKKALEEKIKEILNYLLPEEDSDDYLLISSLLEAITLNQKRLVENDDDNLARTNLNLTKELAFSKKLSREKIEEFCQKSAELAEITAKENRIEFIEEQGKTIIKFNH